MSDQPAVPPPEGEQEITASVTIAGAPAALLRELAAAFGQTSEALALEWASGALCLPTEPIGEDPRAPEWGLFDGPADLSSRIDEHLEGMGVR